MIISLSIYRILIISSLGLNQNTHHMFAGYKPTFCKAWFSGVYIFNLLNNKQHEKFKNLCSCSIITYCSYIRELCIQMQTTKKILGNSQTCIDYDNIMHHAKLQRHKKRTRSSIIDMSSIRYVLYSAIINLLIHIHYDVIYYYFILGYTRYDH